MNNQLVFRTMLKKGKMYLVHHIISTRKISRKKPGYSPDKTGRGLISFTKPVVVMFVDLVYLNGFFTDLLMMLLFGLLVAI